jgi:hypothetical protein
MRAVLGIEVDICYLNDSVGGGIHQTVKLARLWSSSMNILSLFDLVSPFFRRRRMDRFLKLFAPTSNTRICDIGGYPDFWKDVLRETPITVLNIHPVASPRDRPHISTVLGDGTNLRYADNEFDILFSNSVIEHLGSFENQQRFARECMRVGRALWIQTPARSFPIEPHFLTPFIHYLPRGWRRRLLRNFTVWGWLGRPSDQQVDEMVSEIRLLDLKELKELFPGCGILKEKFLLLTKSYIVVRKA